MVDGRKLTDKAVATRVRIIETATQMFARDGYASVTIRDIAASAGLSSGAIYATFRGKSDLLVEAVRTSIDRDLEGLPDEVAEMPVPEVDAYQFRHASGAARTRLRKLLLEAAVAARTDPVVRRQLGEILRSRIDDWTAAHDEGSPKIEFDPSVELRTLVTLLVCIDLGMGVLGELGVKAPSGDQTALLISRLLDAITVEPPKRPRSRR